MTTNAVKLLTTVRNAYIADAIDFLDTETSRAWSAKGANAAAALFQTDAGWFSVSADDLAKLGEALDEITDDDTAGRAAILATFIAGRSPLTFGRDEFTLESDTNYDAEGGPQDYVSVLHTPSGCGADLYADGWYDWQEGNGLASNLPAAAFAIRDAAEEMLAALS